ncbi:hypothetical protein Ccrd_007138 [Cynara cardunculus var. scolymus]|uniref:Uncharacterized protein n=1 Tax=Cynara cardunculus var. scolymus TaxID=59895 RepID=A0A103XHM3_CYNCS|nr:hypothetical protein Ccrd_007138 [Cynara cardunculus var. scolymus]
MNKMYQSTTWLHYSGTNCDDETWFPNASVHLFWKLFPPKTTCITLTLALLNGWWSPRTFSMINLENPWEILDGFIKEMVNINEFPSDGTMNSNGSDRSNFRTPIIRNVKEEPLMEMENEDRVLYSGNTLAGDGEAEIPVIGMTFNSFEEVREFYGKYAAGKGFDIITRSTKSDVEGKIKYYTLACSRSGKALRTACHSIVEIGAETEEGFELALNLLDEVKERMFEHKSESSRNNEEPSGSSAKDGEAAKHYGEELQRSLVVRRRGRPPTKKKKVHFSPDTWTNNPSARNNSNGQNLRRSCLWHYFCEAHGQIKIMLLHSDLEEFMVFNCWVMITSTR